MNNKDIGEVFKKYKVTLNGLSESEALKRLYNRLGIKTIADVHLGDFGLQMGLVIEELKRLIDFYGYTKNFEETNVYEQFAELYLQSWMYSNQRFIDEVHELQNKIWGRRVIC